MSDDAFYKLIADELEQNETDRVLWTRALAEAGGDSDKTKALYIRLRLVELKKRAALSSPQPTLKFVSASAPKTSENGLILLRTELSELLRMNKKSSFYSVLNMTPEATDSELGLAISSYEAKIESGVAMPSPEFKYAKETLENPKVRELYDRRLFARFAEEAAIPSRGRGSMQDGNDGVGSVFLSLWTSRKSTVIIGVMSLAVVGYMLLGFYKERGITDARGKTIDAQVLQTNRSADNDATRAGTENALVQGVIGNQGKTIDSSAQMGNRSLDIRQDEENRRRQELEYRANAGGQMLEMQRQNQDRQLAMQEQRLQDAKRQAEERRVANEKRYWACMNAALDRMSAANAGASCAGYR